MMEPGKYKRGHLIVATLLGFATGWLVMLILAAWFGPGIIGSEWVKLGAAQWVVDPDTGATSLEFCDCFKAPPPDGGK